MCSGKEGTFWPQETMGALTRLARFQCKGKEEQDGSGSGGKAGAPTVSMHSVMCMPFFAVTGKRQHGMRRHQRMPSATAASRRRR